MAASMAAASWSAAPPNRWPATRKATPPKPCARCPHDLSSGQSVAQALLPAASPLLGTLLVRHRVTPAKSVETSLDTAGMSARATCFSRANMKNESHMFKPTIFREYDIRGAADVELLDPDVTQLGRAFGTYLRRHAGKRLSLGRDTRLSSPRLRDAL